MLFFFTSIAAGAAPYQLVQPKKNQLAVYKENSMKLAELDLGQDELLDARLGDGFVVVRKASEPDRLFIYDLHLKLIVSRVIGRNASIRSVSASEQKITVEHVTGWTYVYNRSLTEIGKYNEFVLER